MRKPFKALVGVLAAVVTLLTGGLMAGAASADEPMLIDGETTSYKVIVENESPDYAYEAYQIFAGDVSVKDGKKTLSNIKWGNGVTEDGQKALLKQYKASDAAGLAALLTTEDQARDFAQIVGQYLSSDKTTSTFVQADPDNEVLAHHVISGLQAGYYLIKDSEVPDGAAHTEYILQVVGDAVTTPKSANAPTMVKKVGDVNDSAGPDITWQDSADYDVTDKVPFRLTATLPQNYDSYPTYGLRFHDVMSEGLTFDAESVKVYAANTDEEWVELSGDSYRVSTKEALDGETFNVVIPDLKAATKATGETADLKIDATTKIVVSYDATLNEGASVGATGNPNEAWLEFSNNPNVGNENSTATTPKDKVTVFTYELIVNKTDGENPLAGAAFKLEKKIADLTTAGFHWTEVATTTAKDDVTSFNFSGLDDGDYRLTEITTPEGYNTIEPIEFTITAVHDVEADEPQLHSFTVKGFGDDITSALGNATVTVVNNAGSELPETGGMGTTVLYAAGAVIVIAAALGLAVVLRKRQSLR